MSDPPAAEGERLGRDSLVLGLSSILAGALVYVYIISATRSLGATDAAPIAVLWTWLNIAGSALTFPVEHWVMGEVERSGGEGPVRAVVGRLVAGVLVLSVVLGLGAWGAREQLFGTDDVIHPIVLAVMTAQAALTGLTRGVLSARRRFVASAASYVGENLLRAAAAVALATAGAAAGGFSAAILLGPLVVLAWPAAILPARDPQASPGQERADLGALRHFAGATLLAQLVLTGPPLLLAALGGDPASVTRVFSVCTLLRLPHIFARRAVGTITGVLTRWVVRGERSLLEQAWRRTVLATSAATVLATAAAAAIGPAILEVVFGADLAVDAGQAALVAAGTAVALGTLVLMLVLLARGAARLASVIWAASIALGVPTLLVAPGDLADRVLWAYATVQIAAFVGTAAAEHAANRPAGVSPRSARDR